MHIEYEKILLFRGLSDSETDECLSDLKSYKKTYKKGSLIIHAGTRTDQMGIVLNGSVHIESNDIWGNCTILSHVNRFGFFAETYALFPKEVLLVDVRANEECRILFLKTSRLSSFEHKSWHKKLLANLLTITAHKNLVLSGRSFHTASHTIRGRVLSYLNSVSLKNNSKEFDIPFDRQQLADYLNVERTALSKELGKMKRDNLLDFRRNHFVLK